MICILALIVFGILGIFSASYRVIAKEAFSCVFKKITFQKCDTRLDTRLKSEITGKLLKFNHRLGKIVYKYFEVFSWILLILTLVTLFFMGLGLYNYVLYGNCNGPNSDDFCIYDPLGKNKPQNVTSSSVCAIPEHTEIRELKTPPLGELRSGTYLGNLDAKVVIIEFGCYSCHYTKEVESTIKKVIEKYGDKILYVYKDFPLSETHANAMCATEAVHCALDQGKYWEYREYVFANQQQQFEEDLVSYAKELNLNITQFKSCLDEDKYKSLVNQSYIEGINSGITVTPTFFINNQTIIGAKDFKEFKKAINKELGINWWEFWK
ncbi:MAG: DsbA family protein [Candidatus Woesearchaeota archaeon]